MPTVRIKEDMYVLLINRAKAEEKKLDQLVNELLHKILWNEPMLLFKGKHYKVDPDMFGTFEPKPGEIEE